MVLAWLSKRPSHFAAGQSQHAVPTASYSHAFQIPVRQQYRRLACPSTCPLCVCPRFACRRHDRQRAIHMAGMAKRTDEAKPASDASLTQKRHTLNTPLHAISLAPYTSVISRPRHDRQGKPLFTALGTVVLQQVRGAHGDGSGLCASCGSCGPRRRRWPPCPLSPLPPPKAQERMAPCWRRLRAQQQGACGQGEQR